MHYKGLYDDSRVNTIPVSKRIQMLVQSGFIELAQRILRRYLCPRILEQNEELPKKIRYPIEVMFKTSNIEIVHFCQNMSGLQLPSVLLGSRYQKFLSDVPSDVYSWIVVVVSFFFAAYFATLWWIKMNIYFVHYINSIMQRWVLGSDLWVETVWDLRLACDLLCWLEIWPRYLVTLRKLYWVQNVALRYAYLQLIIISSIQTLSHKVWGNFWVVNSTTDLFILYISLSCRIVDGGLIMFTA